MKALILAGGKGTRLRPITYEIPKPLVPVKGKPIVQHLIENLKAYGITDIIMSVGYLHQKIMDYFGDGSRFGVKIEYIVEKDEMGTGGPLRLAEKMLTDTFLVINGDGLFEKINVGKLVETHRKRKALVTLTLARTEDPSRFGVVVMD